MNTLRITGLASGMDTETMIADLMKVEKMKVDQVEQKKDYTIWKQESYRDTINNIKNFNDEFFDVTNRDHYLMSENTFNTVKMSIETIDVEDINAVAVSATADALKIDHVIKDVSIAQKDRWQGEDSAILKSSELDWNSIEGGTFDLELDGIKKTLTLKDKYDDMADLINDLQGKVDAVFGSDRMTFSDNGVEMEIKSEYHKVVVYDTNSDDTTLSQLGLDSGDKNTLDLNAVLGETNFARDLFAGGETISFSINDEVFSFDKATDTITDVMETINNNEQVNVSMTYSEFTNDFILESKDEGYNAKIEFEDITGNFFSAGLNMDQSTSKGYLQEGKDATFNLDGNITTRSSNNFTIEGINYRLNKDTIGEVKINAELNTTDTKETIISFVEKYNEMVENINDKLNEEKYRDYKPLTDAERKGLSEDEIVLWEEKAKSGLLKNDDLLETFMFDMRALITDSVDGVNMTLMEMGITTSSNYKDGGKLVVNQTKLEEALESNQENIKKFFTDTEAGFSVKMKKVMDNNIKVTGEKGILLKKAGVEGNTSEYSNVLSEQIKAYDERINTLIEKLSDKEASYYHRFGRMEKALAEMNSQMDYLSSQMGGL